MAPRPGLRFGGGSRVADINQIDLWQLWPDDNCAPAMEHPMLASSWGITVGVMRCMAGGGEMTVAAVASDDATMPAGFRHETLQCAACGDVERRFVFGRSAMAGPAPPAPRPEQPTPSGPECTVPASLP